MNFQIFSRSCPLAARKLHVSSVVNTSKPSPLIDSIIRVDHAGELGADRIYAGQMAVLGNSKMGPLIQHMWDQEKVHKATFEELIVKHRVRPTAFVPIWNVAGFLLGAGTALMGEKAAMACTVAVESVIVDHYNDQLRELMNEPEKNKELLETIRKFRDDEQEHHDCGIDHGAEQAPFYRALTEVIKVGCKTAIALSKGLLSQRNQCTIASSRSYSTGSEETPPKPKYDLYSAVCLERKPVIMKPLNEMERKMLETFREMEYERSHKSNHEIKAEDDQERAIELKKNVRLLDLNVVLQQTAHEFEEVSNKEFEAFQPAPCITLDDEKNNLRSLNRQLSNHLLLLVRHKIGGNEMWLLPHGIRTEPETMRETAERVLRESFGEELKVLFLGNAPCGFYKWKYSKPSESNSVGGKMFFFKVIYISGSLKKNDTVLDYQWVVRSELKNLLPRAYFRKVSKFLIDEEETNHAVGEEQEKIVLERAQQGA